MVLKDQLDGHQTTELTDRIIPSRGFTRSGPGKLPEITDAELVCLAVAQVLLRYDDERHWLRAAPKLVGCADFAARWPPPFARMPLFWPA